jgi:predicted phage baseplate assembly protein
MALAVPNLDDRKFQEIVDQAKRLIPLYCREWTDHNVSDPGVALIELFAWMTDMLLYRVNQVPDVMHVKFLEMIGAQLAPPRAATVPVTFYLSAPQSVEVTIPQDTEVATIRTETSPATIFTTEAPLAIRPPRVIRASTRVAGAESGAPWIEHDLRRLGLPGQRINLFTPPPASPAPDDAFYLTFDEDHGNHVFSLMIECEVAGGAGIDPRNPPLVWEVYQGVVAGWAPCTVEYDGTGGFNRSGELILHAPAMGRREVQGTTGYWLRCRLTEAQASAERYRVSPEISGLSFRAVGGTTTARHATSVHGEVIGISNGTPGQTFHLLHAPVLTRDPDLDYLTVELPGGQIQRWQEVSDFGDSTKDDLHYVLDSMSGALSFGPALLQPDGQVYLFGATPAKDSVLRFDRYQYGGGVAGNVPQGALSVPKSSIPYLARVTNWKAAVGGLDAQSIEDAKLRAPQFLRTRTRAVTVDDYEFLARQVEGVARARCIAPGAQTDQTTEPRPGSVMVLLVPHVDEPAGRIPAEQLARSAELRARVLAFLNERRPLGITVDVRQPQYIWVAVSAVLRLPLGANSALAESVERQAERELYRFLSPIVGGPQGAGWPFGRDLSVSEIYGLLQRIPGVEFVEDVQINVVEPGGAGDAQPATGRLVVPRDGLVACGQHQVRALARVDS